VVAVATSFHDGGGNRPLSSPHGRYALCISRIRLFGTRTLNVDISYMLLQPTVPLWGRALGRSAALREPDSNARLKNVAEIDNIYNYYYYSFLHCSSAIRAYDPRPNCKGQKN
jgi:hypothetical protein